MAGETATLDRIDEILATVSSLPEVLEECCEIVDGLPEEGIRILPTEVDGADICVGATGHYLLPPVARRAGALTVAALGQRRAFLL